jgi:hypothetical protein
MLRRVIQIVDAQAFWITIHPSDLRDPLVVKLARVALLKDGVQKATAGLRKKAANMNPVFFHKVCSAVLEALVSPKDTDMGILGGRHINLLQRRRIKQPWNAVANRETSR